ncbi:MAG: hypothetical protein ACRD04_06875 [Terriglobales bacterium]
MQTLETEINFLSQHRDDLLKQYGGKFLVIRGPEVAGAYDSITEALEAGTTAFGCENFLIRQPLESAMIINAPAYTLGILQASPIADSSH